MLVSSPAASRSAFAASRCTTARRTCRSRAARRRGTAGCRRRQPPARGRARRAGAYPVSYRLDVELDELEPIGDGARLDGPPRDGRPPRARRAGRRAATPSSGWLLRQWRARGDRVVLRTGTTVGGGVVLDPAPPVTPTPSASSCSRAGTSRRSCTRPSAPLRGHLVDGELTGVEAGRRLGFLPRLARGASRASFTRPRRPPTRSTPESHRPPSRGRATSCRFSVSSGVARALSARLRTEARRALRGSRARSSVSSSRPASTP